ncbi:MAG: HisA/HisF-related TIM barrel protein [Bernardetiaceae bacterium]
MIELVPAIDLLGNACVRLTQGDYTRARAYSQDPLDQAQIFEQVGFRRLHIVDLAGAKSGSPQHLHWLEKIATRTKLVIDFGGGIKDLTTAQRVLDAGASMINVGSIAVKAPDVFAEWLQHLGGERILLAADTLNEQLVTHAWQDASTLSIWDFIPPLQAQGLAQFFCTDVKKDGALQGMDHAFYARLRETFPTLQITASGGLTAIDDIHALEAIGLEGVIVGKAWYEGRLTAKDLQPWL